MYISFVYLDILWKMEKRSWTLETTGIAHHCKYQLYSFDFDVFPLVSVHIFVTVILPKIMICHIYCFNFLFVSFRYYACLCGHHELVEFLLQNGEVVLIANRFNTGFVTTCALSKRRKMRTSHADTDLTGYYSRFWLACLVHYEYYRERCKTDCKATYRHS